MPSESRSGHPGQPGADDVQVLQPAHWAQPRGYAHGVGAKGRLVFVSGMIGCDTQGKLASGDFVAQVRQALQNVVAVLAEADARPEHIVRMTWYVVDKREYVGARKEIGVVYREIIGRHYPTMTAVEVADLIEEHARVEIEVTAVVPE